MLCIYSADTLSQIVNLKARNSTFVRRQLKNTRRCIEYRNFAVIFTICLKSIVILQIFTQHVMFCGSRLAVSGNSVQQPFHLVYVHIRTGTFRKHFIRHQAALHHAVMSQITNNNNFSYFTDTLFTQNLHKTGSYKMRCNVPMSCRQKGSNR